jgi:hypothetical protein
MPSPAESAYEGNEAWPCPRNRQGKESLAMNVAQDYTQSALVPRLRSFGLSKRQWEIVAEDVTQRLESVLSHWNDESFRRTILVLGTEEASFWEPRTASLEIRSLVVVAVRNSLIEDLGASRPYFKVLQSRKPLVPDDRMPWITTDAVKFFEVADFDSLQIKPAHDVFGDLPRRFPNAWHALSLLGDLSDSEIACELPMAESEPIDLPAFGTKVEHHAVVASGIDPRLDDQLLKVMSLVKAGELELFFSPSFKSITRNPEKLLSVIDHVLRFGGTVLTQNYLLSSTYLARRNPLLRPIHYNSELEAQLANSEGLSERHKGALALLISSD